MSERPRVQIHYKRPPDRVQLFDQAVVYQDDAVIVTLAEDLDFDPPLRVDGEIALERGSSVVWFTFPGAWHDIGRFHRADGTFVGFYANVLTPVEITDQIWHTTDLFLDVWLSAEGQLALLDDDEFEEAVSNGIVDAATAARARKEADQLLAAVRAGTWPPEIATLWTLDRCTSSV